MDQKTRLQSGGWEKILPYVFIAIIVALYLFLLATRGGWEVIVLSMALWIFWGHEHVFEKNRSFILGRMSLISYPERRESGMVYVIQHCDFGYGGYRPGLAFEVVGENLEDALKKLIPEIRKDTLQKLSPSENK